LIEVLLNAVEGLALLTGLLAFFSALGAAIAVFYAVLFRTFDRLTR
jgi:hypothetical protein